MKKGLFVFLAAILFAISFDFFHVPLYITYPLGFLFGWFLGDVIRLGKKAFDKTPSS